MTGFKRAWRKVKEILGETAFLVREHKLYFLAPLLLLLAFSSLLFFHAGAQAVVTFIYAGL